MDRNIEMFMNVEKALIQNKCLIMPNVYIRPEVDKNIKEKVKDIIKRHQGTITGNSIKINFSHDFTFRFVHKTY